MDTALKFQFRTNSMTSWEIWSAIEPWFLDTYGKPDLLLDDKPVQFDSIAEIIQSARMPSAVLSIQENGLVSFGEHRSAGIMNLACFRFQEDRMDVERLLSHLKSSDLILGRLYNKEYERWQGVRQIERYEYASREHQHLPRKWNAALRMEVIDTSNNPGRTSICDGYIEAIGSPMWIGPLFQERTGGDWRGMKEYDWCEIAELDNGVVRLTSWDGPFDSDQGEQRERQEILRKVLFPQPPEESRHNTSGSDSQTEEGIK